MSGNFDAEIGRGLERSCEAGSGDAVLASQAAPGLIRMAARFAGNAYSLHRHDTYGLGLTKRGVQTFHYRGERRVSLPGEIIVLHPDELHDGGAGSPEPLIYRMLYLEPERVLAAGGRGRGLPFVPQPVLSDAAFSADLARALASLDEPLEDLEATDLVAAIAGHLFRLGDAPAAEPTTAAVEQVRLACRHLSETTGRPVPSEELEGVTGLDRYALSRHFRRVTGTSPHRFHLMRRLELARTAIGDGWPLAAVAADLGFADQAHMSRHFRKAFGLTPGAWGRMAVAGRQAGL